MWCRHMSSSNDVWTKHKADSLKLSTSNTCVQFYGDFCADHQNLEQDNELGSSAIVVVHLLAQLSNNKHEPYHCKPAFE